MGFGYFFKSVIVATTVLAIALGKRIFENTREDTSNSSTTEPNQFTSNSGTTEPNQFEPNSESNKSGRARRKKTNRHDDDSSSTLRNKSPPLHNVARHILTRFKRWFRFGGILQRITVDTRLNYNEIILGETSVYQDRHSGLGRPMHAAHVVRAGTVNSILQTENRTHYQGLVDFLGHTQNVPMAANVFHGVGGGIDRFQTNANYLIFLNTINFNPDESSWDDAMETISVLRSSFVYMLMEYMGGLSDGEMKNQICEAIQLIASMDLKILFDAGVKGYGADYEAWKRESE